MRVEQAIEILRSYCITGDVSNVSTEDLERHIAVTMAIEKLNLDIPKKAVYDAEKEFYYANNLFCPNCNVLLYSSDWEDYRSKMSYYQKKRCENCGQCLDW